MSVVIKSNQKSTKNMGSLLGAVSSDYKLLANFNLGIYIDRSDNILKDMSFSDMFLFKRASNGVYVGDSNQIVTVKNDEPRFQLGEDGTRRLLMSTAKTELLSNPYSPTTQTVTVDAGGYVFLRVKGTGQAVLSGAAIDTAGDNQLIAKEGELGVAKIAGEGGILTVTVTGSLSVFGMSKASTDFTPNGDTKTAADTLEVDPILADKLLNASPSFTMVMTYRESLSSRISTSKSSIFSFVESTERNAYEGLYIGRIGGSNPRLTGDLLKGTSNSNVGSVNAYEATGTQTRKTAVTFSSADTNFRVASNGTVYKSSTYIPTPLAAKRILISTANTYLSRTYNTEIESLAFYDYAMTDSQLLEITS